jgi:hypothetical protein
MPSARRPKSRIIGGFATDAAEAQIAAIRALEEAPEVGPLMRLLSEP